MLLLVPLVAFQVLTINSLRDRNAAAAEARRLAGDIDLMGEVGALYAPVALEAAASIGLAEVDRIGVDRQIVLDVTGLDYAPYIERARVEADQVLDHLEASHSDLLLPDGQTLGVRTTMVRAEIAEQRDLLDRRSADVDTLSAAFASLDQLVLDLSNLTLSVHREVTVDPTLGTIADEVTHLLTVVDAIAEDTTATSLVLGASVTTTTPTDALLAAGAADFMIQQYALDFTPGESPAWTETYDQLQSYIDLRPQVVSLLDERFGQKSNTETNVLISDPAMIRTLATVMLASFDRLSAIGDYAAASFDDSIMQADRIAAAADDDVRVWTGMIIVLTMASIGLLILTVVSTERPLRRLTTRALDLGQGIVDPDPIELSGPSDVRAVTATFNTVSQLLSSFDTLIRQLTSGRPIDAQQAANVPGMLGSSLRAQIEHLSDVTARLRESEALSRAIIETAADAIWTVDSRGRILTANDAAEQLLGVDAGEQLGRSLLPLLGLRDRLGDVAGELELHRRDGSTVDVLVSHSEVPAEPEPIHAVFARDISDRKRFEQQLAHQARHDGLTSLPNRLAALEHLDRAVARAQRKGSSVAVLFVDLDGFKSVNDSRGHASGDRLLHEVGDRLRNTLRSGEFVARLGGDEFLVVGEAMPVEAAEALGTRVIREIAQPYVQGEDLFTISASVGIAVANGSEQIDGLELVREADVAVYHAKERGRSRVVVFDASLQEAVEATAEIELALRQAIGDDELVLHYQPVLDLASGTAWGVEALVRWNRPGHGLLGADRFVPVAERSSLVIDLGRWVIHDACRTLASWQADPNRRDLRIAVNVSGRHLVEGNLIADLDEIIGLTGVDPTGLEVELTETHLLADFERANLVLTALRERGISVAVDDFGTGYSSMGYLRQLDIDAIKIDRMFVARVVDIGYDRTIVEVLVQLGLTLNLDIVAEGVETQEQLDFVRSRNCTRAQGYHIAMPMPLGDLDTWLDAQSTERRHPINA
jgi:diguanylate cyclase (GGDEF)-like protein/PAS domain S-box-containing protein